MPNPMFQHRHYVAIAQIIESIMDNETRMHTAVMFADNFARDNSRFSRERFMAACEGKPVNGRDK